MSDVFIRLLPLACLFRPVFLFSLGVCCELSVARAASCFFILLLLFTLHLVILGNYASVDSFAVYGVLILRRTECGRESLGRFCANGEKQANEISWWKGASVFEADCRSDGSETNGWSMEQDTSRGRGWLVFYVDVGSVMKFRTF